MPRDGAGVVRRPRHRRAHQRRVRGREGRPRGASAGRRRLHGRSLGLHAESRLATHGLRHPARAHLLRRHLLAAAGAPLDARIPRRARGGAGGVDAASCAGGGIGGCRDRRARPRGGVHAFDPAGRRRDRDRGAGDRAARGSAVRRLRGSPEVPCRHDAALPAAPARAGGRSRGVGGHRTRARRDGGLRPSRCGWRVLPVCDPARLDGAALRADADRQRAAARCRARRGRRAHRARHRFLPDRCAPSRRRRIRRGAGLGVDDRRRAQRGWVLPPPARRTGGARAPGGRRQGDHRLERTRDRRPRQGRRGARRAELDRCRGLCRGRGAADQPGCRRRPRAGVARRTGIRRVSDRRGPRPSRRRPVRARAGDRRGDLGDRGAQHPRRGTRRHGR